MKKTLLYILSITILISFTGCSSNMNEKHIENNLVDSQEIEKDDATKDEAVEDKDAKDAEGKIAEDDVKDSEMKSDETKDGVAKDDMAKETDKANQSAATIQSDKKSTEQRNVDENNLEIKTVVIDPGHGAGGNREKERQSPESDIMKIKDPGGAQGISTGTPEYEVNMKVALKLKSLLEQNSIKVVMTRTENSVSPGNIDRAEVGNANNADLAIRIHCDSAENQSAHGASMLVPAPIGYAKNISQISRKYGEIILNGLVVETQTYNRGVVQRDDMTGFNWSKVPVVLVEMGFMSNNTEDALLSSDNYQSKLAQGLCNGILEALRG